MGGGGKEEQRLKADVPAISFGGSHFELRMTAINCFRPSTSENSSSSFCIL